MLRLALLSRTRQTCARQLRSASSHVHDKKVVVSQKKKIKEKKRLVKLEESVPQKKITTQLSSVEYDIPVAPGCKKDVSCPLPATYSSRFVEACWYKWWEKEGYFKPAKRRKTGTNDVFSMVIPPPNVTGKLHLGHALTVALEDVLCRWNRMRGKEVLWIPGCDHAGIATQAVVEKLLTKKNISRRDLGRQQFTGEVWKWKDQKEKEIYDQLRVLGASLDWDKTNFTLDPEYSYAVREAFIRLHEKNLIVRKQSLINWSSSLQSTISDIEIDMVSLSGPTKISVPGYKKPVEFGVMHSFSYPLLIPTQDRSSIEVSTTRIETMLGDTGIAVNPDDSRYSSLVGSYVRHPILQDVTMPIVADSHVDKDFGTGAVKITPGHDFNDFAIGERHNLPVKDILDDFGNISCPLVGELDNMPRFLAKEKIISLLDNQGLYRGKVAHEMSLPICSRSGDVVEPRLKIQWFVRTKELAQQALKAVETGQIRIEPDSYLGDWNNWLTNNTDWCISRQLWWGHRIPAYNITDLNGESTWVCGHSEEQAREKAKHLFQDKSNSFTVIQDEDVLDTWFSSALFPFVSLGWPEETDDLKKFYPLSIMETGYDLLFFWVARMAMMGLSLTDKVPFKVVYLHSMVRDSQGRKMSKSLGNVIDPNEVIYGCTGEQLDAKIKAANLSPKEEKYALKDRAKTLPHGIPECGTDALRFYLCLNRKSGKDISLDIHSVVQYRYFCNKIWNVFKFLDLNVSKQQKSTPIQETTHLRPVDLWVRSRLSAVIGTANSALESLNFAAAASSLHKFFFVDFADFYLESCKTIFNSDVEAEIGRRQAIENNFEMVFETFLRLLSPFMPYITEEIWQRLPNRDPAVESLMIARYPVDELQTFRNTELENDIDTVRSVIQSLRNIKATFRVSKSLLPDVHVVCLESNDFNALQSNRDIIQDLTKMGKLEICENDPENYGMVMYSVGEKAIKIFMKLQGLIDVDSQYKVLQSNAETYGKKIEITKEKLESCKNDDLRSRLNEKIKDQESKLNDIENIIVNLDRLR